MQKKKFFSDKKFYWNSGMFLFSAKTLIREMNLHSQKNIRNLQDVTKKK